MKPRQCKDVPDVDVLRAIARRAEVRTHGVASASLFDLRDDLALPPRLARSKLERLIDRGLVDGCACGCRGDFVLTDEGTKAIIAAAIDAAGA